MADEVIGGSHWIDSYNSSWTREDLYLMLSVGGTQYLYEKLAANGELDAKIVFGPSPSNDSLLSTKFLCMYGKPFH